jgi:hypothetical protein
VLPTDAKPAFGVASKSVAILKMRRAPPASVTTGSLPIALRALDERSLASKVPQQVDAALDPTPQRAIQWP